MGHLEQIPHRYACDVCAFGNPRHLILTALAGCLNIFHLRTREKPIHRPYASVDSATRTTSKKIAKYRYEKVAFALV